MHKIVDLKVLYFGTPVVLIGSRNPDGTANLAPMSSAWWLNQSCMLGLGNAARTTANLRRTGTCVLNLAPSSLATAVDRLALTTGANPVPPRKAAMGYRHVSDKFSLSGLTPVDDLRVAECPIHLECEISAAHAFGPRATAFQADTLRAHVDDAILVPGTSYVDTRRWDPLIMKFCDFFGDATPLRPSRLATAWQIPGRVH